MVVNFAPSWVHGIVYYHEKYLLFVSAESWQDIWKDLIIFWLEIWPNQKLIYLRFGSKSLQFVVLSACCVSTLFCVYFVYWLESKKQVFCPDAPPRPAPPLLRLSLHLCTHGNHHLVLSSIPAPSSSRKICRFKFRHSEATLFTLWAFQLHCACSLSIFCCLCLSTSPP